MAMAMQSLRHLGSSVDGRDGGDIQVIVVSLPWVLNYKYNVLII